MSVAITSVRAPESKNPVCLVSDSPLRSIDCSYSDLKFTLFGTDLQKIPCFKKTFTVSTYCGIAAGLACFF
ncbi:hypothetical protein TNCV_1630761 [Trichonephila clavipes]|nr:hypothetical protein TNCV_1630761 [Trichonephila clavipes]